MFLFMYRLPIIIHDSIIVALVWTLAIVVRYDLPLSPEIQNILWQSLPIVILIQSIILWYSRLYQGIWRFFSIPDIAIIFRAAIIGTLAIALILVLFNRLAFIPRSSLLFYPLFLIFFLGVPRLFYRLWYEHSFLLTTKNSQRVLVLGAGRAGDMLVRDMLRSPDGGYIPVGFLDDQKRLHGGKVQGVPILGTLAQLTEVVESLEIHLIVIAMPSATDQQMQQIVELCEKSKIPFRTLPKLDDIVANQVNLNSLRDVDIDDLLGRSKVQLDWQIIQAGLQQKTVLVSGGGGSIGAELCRQIARLNPTALVILERTEFNLYTVEMQLRQEFPQLQLHACLGDIVDPVAVHYLLSHYRPQVIFHAAAYKHVPMLQTQMREATKNNVLGTKILAEIAVQQGCEIFVMISTDKAVNPTNIMGTTKRIAEIFCQAMNKNHHTRFITVRFGNVLGSAGSVVPLFKKQIASGGPITVTHPEITRYFMTIPEACQLILQAGAMGKGGEIFVLDMGTPVNIKYLAQQMIRLSGKVPDKEIKVIYTGLRPGEKLHEELFHSEEKLQPTEHNKILLADHRPTDYHSLIQALDALTVAINLYADEQIMEILTTLVPEMMNDNCFKKHTHINI